MIDSEPRYGVVSQVRHLALELVWVVQAEPRDVSAVGDVHTGVVVACRVGRKWADGAQHPAVPREVHPEGLERCDNHVQPQVKLPPLEQRRMPHIQLRERLLCSWPEATVGRESGPDRRSPSPQVLLGHGIHQLDADPLTAPVHLVHVRAVSSGLGGAQG